MIIVIFQRIGKNPYRSTIDADDHNNYCACGAMQETAFSVLRDYFVGRDKCSLV